MSFWILYTPCNRKMPALLSPLLWLEPLHLVFVKIYVNSSPGLNFINIPRTSFTLVDPKSVKRYWWLDWVLTLWGAKADRKYVDEIDPLFLIIVDSETMKSNNYLDSFFTSKITLLSKACDFGLILVEQKRELPTWERPASSIIGHVEWKKSF